MIHTTPTLNSPRKWIRASQSGLKMSSIHLLQQPEWTNHFWKKIILTNF